jgi:iron complex transport system substrate-binding protein
VLISAHRTGGLSASELCKQPALERWAQAQGCNLHIVDALLFLGLTPRLPIAVGQFTDILEQ